MEKLRWVVPGRQAGGRLLGPLDNNTLGAPYQVGASEIYATGKRGIIVRCTGRRACDFVRRTWEYTSLHCSQSILAWFSAVK